MNGISLILIGIALALVLGTLVIGLVTMARGGPNAGQRSNRFMRLRVLFQAIAVALVLIAFFISRHP